MYNGIGLQTAKGSGTSGYVQRNLSHFKNQMHSREDFLKKLKEIHEKPIEASRKANIEILAHEQKREVQLHLLELREKLEEMGQTGEQIEYKLKKAEEKLNDKMMRGEIDLSKNAHSQTLAKQKDYEQMKEAFQIKGDHSLGKAFARKYLDFDGQKRIKLENEYEREVKKSEKIQKYIEMKMQEKKELRQSEKQKKKDEKLMLKKNKKQLKKEEKINKRQKTSSISRSSSSSSSNNRIDRRSRSKDKFSKNQQHKTIVYPKTEQNKRSLSEQEQTKKLNITDQMKDNSQKIGKFSSKESKKNPKHNIINKQRRKSQSSSSSEDSTSNPILIHPSRCLDSRDARSRSWSLKKEYKQYSSKSRR